MAAAAGLKQAELDGRRWLIAPVVAIVEGVLNGEYVPGQEISRYVAAWQGIPLVLDHPRDPAGNYMSANDPRVLSRYGVGRFFNVTYDKPGKRLKGEAWIDLDKARRLGGDAAAFVDRVQRGERVEVSTAYFRDIEEAAGEFAAKSYKTISRNIRPDHLAILLHDIGACSWGDGCGLPRVNQATASAEAEIPVAFCNCGESSPCKGVNNMQSESATLEQLPILAAEDTEEVTEEAAVETVEVEAEDTEEAAAEDTEAQADTEEVEATAEDTEEDTEEPEAEPVAVDPADQPEAEADDREMETLRQLARIVEANGGIGNLQALLEAGQEAARAAAEDKKATIAALAGNANCRFTASELDAFTLPQLRKLKASLEPVNYAARGGAYVNANAAESDDNSPPPIFG